MERKTNEIRILRRMLELRSAIQESKDNIAGLNQEVNNVKTNKTYILNTTPALKVNQKNELEKIDREWKKKCDEAQNKAVIGLVASLILIVVLAIFIKNLWIGLGLGVAALLIYAGIDSKIQTKHKIHFNDEKEKVKERYTELIKEAEKKDSKDRKRKDADIAELRKKKRAELATQFEEEYALKDAYEREYAEISIISKNDIDNDPQIIEKILYLMESNRADNVKEALLQLDEAKRQQEHASFVMAMQDFYRFQAEQARRDQAERDLQQTIHNARMEQQTRKIQKEIEEVRKDQEFYQRYGTPR